jgi:predicted nucleic acid-binding protein
LDADVLFSAAYREDGGVGRLWALPDATLLTSGYAREEARRNLATDEQKARLTRLVDDLEVVAEAGPTALPEDVDLPEKDRPILRAALRSNATHLVTGDLTHFGTHLGDEIEGVRVVRPADLLRG